METKSNYILDKIRNKLEYDAYNGRLLLKGTFVDKSTKTHQGYRQIYVDGTCYLLHRLIYFYHHGEFPRIVDHIDGDKNNNRIENLQGCDQSVNIAKAKVFKTNKTGFKGVSYNKTAKKYESYFIKNYKKVHCGLFDTPEEAFKAREERKYGHREELSELCNG